MAEDRQRASLARLPAAGNIISKMSARLTPEHVPLQSSVNVGNLLFWTEKKGIFLTSFEALFELVDRSHFSFLFAHH